MFIPSKPKLVKIIFKSSARTPKKTPHFIMAVLPLRRRDWDSIRKKVNNTLFMASRHRIVVALMGEAPLRTEGSTSRRL
jgi:hypothetical protein